MGIEGKLLVSRKNIVVNKESIGIDNDLTKDRNMNTFKTYCKRRKSGARFPDRKANNRLCACHCIAGNAWLHPPWFIVASTSERVLTNWHPNVFSTPPSKPRFFSARKSMRSLKSRSRQLQLPRSVTLGPIPFFFVWERQRFHH